MGLFSGIFRKLRSLRRYNQILRVFMRYGFEDIVAYMIENKRFAFIRKLVPRATQKHVQQFTKWERIRMVCEELGPTFVKFGQILSNRTDILPAPLILEFEKLQDKVPPIPGEKAKEVVEQELKGLVTELFAQFENDAFASASMAQVHKAVLKSGEKVVLKIQRPEIKQIIIEDIRVMYTLADIFERRVPSLRSFDLPGLVRHFEDSIMKELDFIHESVNLQRFYFNTSHDDAGARRIHSPIVYREYTTAKVLTMEFISGTKISNYDELERLGHSRKLLAKNLATSYIKQVFQYGFFHADPHPGNLLVLPNGDICFLDFGMMGSILQQDIEMFGRMFIAVKNRDVKKIIRSLQQMSGSFTVKDMRDLEYDINEFVHTYGITSLHANEMSTVLTQLRDIIVNHGLKAPPHFYLLARSMVTVEGVIHNLDPDLDLLDLARPYMLRILKKKMNPIEWGKKIFNTLYEFGVNMEDFPRDLKNAIRRINSGQMKVDLNHHGIDPMVHTINRVTKQLVSALLVAGLIVGSSLLIIHDIGPKWGDSSALGVIGLIMAGLLMISMIRDIMRGDHDNWKGWQDD